MMRFIVFSAALVLFACKAGESSSSSGPPLAPADVPKSIFRARYDLEPGIIKAGTVFAARLSDQAPVLAVTAHHVFGTAGGLRSEVTPDELVKGFAKGQLEDVLKGGAIASLSRPLLIPDAKRFAGELMSTDVAAFVPEQPEKLKPLPLAAARPQLGDTVWLIAAIKGQENGELQHAAKVVLSDDDALIYEFAEPKLELRATSGAPVLSAKGEVVGINLTGGEKDGKLIGMAAAIPNVRKRLEKAISHP